MDASKARDMTTDALCAESEVIRPILDKVYEKIQEAAERGLSEISHPFSGIPCDRDEYRDAVKKTLGVLGYKVVDHSDPDPGSPCSGPYTTVSW